MKLNMWKCACLLFLLCAGTTIAAHAQIFTTTISFNGMNGALPAGSIIQGTDGNLHGTTQSGGTSRQYCPFGCGTVFLITPGNHLRSLSFSYCPFCTGGAYPTAGLVQTTDGSFYGTTTEGGTNNAGTIFKVSPEGVLTTLDNMCSTCVGGGFPQSALLQGTDGNLYGTTTGYGTAELDASVFKITRTGTFTTLHNFGYDAEPRDLVQGTDGSLYGSVGLGGYFNCPIGTCGGVFKLTREDRLQWLHLFKGPDGGNPSAGLVQASDGSFYGTTSSGGAYDSSGTVFKITADGTLTTLHSFSGSDGSNPEGLLVQATDGNFYGTTNNGGANGGGTVFEITSEGTLTTLYNFNSQSGSNPRGGLFQATNGLLYRTTFLDGPRGGGTVFSLDVGLAPFISLVRDSGKIGSPIGILGQGFTGATDVSVNGTGATFTVVSDTYLTAKVPSGATTGFVTVTTPNGTLTSNRQLRVKP